MTLFIGILPSDVIQQGLVRASIGAAGTVTPDEDGQLLGASALSWVVDSVALKRAVGLVVAWCIGTSSTLPRLQVHWGGDNTVERERRDGECESVLHFGSTKG